LRYDVGGDSWARLHYVPFDPMNKRTCRWGTDMVYDGSNFIYLSKGSNTVEVYKYSVAEDSWYTTPLDPAHLSDPYGRRKRVKAGSSIAWLNGYLYLLKGGNTQEFWSYPTSAVPPGDTWVRRTDIPIAITGRRAKVKRGSAMVGVSSTVFCLKGSYSYEFWEYKPAADSGLLVAISQPERQGVMADKLTIGKPGIDLFPNPATRTQVRLHYNLPQAGPVLVRVFDVTGRAVVTKNMVLGREGSVPLDLRNLTAGVYLVRLDATGYRATDKLILER